KPLPLTLLRQNKPDVYRLDRGDVLGVYIENLLGDKSAVPPVRIPETGNVPPSLGYPVPVQENGTIVVPFADPIRVAGLSIDEAIIQRGPPPGIPADQFPAIGETVRIPLRVRPNEPPNFRPEDVVLHDGDIVFIESRETELFYTAGLLPVGEYVLPRDYDLD